MIDGLVSQAGICVKHNVEKMFVGLDTQTEPTCVRCVADATPKLGRLQTVKDPGEHFFNKNAPVNAAQTESITRVQPNTVDLTVESIVSIAIQDLNRLPMPKDIKQFKAIQKVIKTLESLVEKSNG